MIKKISLIIGVLLISALFTIQSCSIDRVDRLISDIFSISTEYVEPNTDELHPWGGYWVYFIENGEITNRIFLSNGADGKDGKDGINGIDGINGKDGVNVTVRFERDDELNGSWMYVQTGELVETIFIADGTDGINGIDGINGLDGIDGVNGLDGASVYVSTEPTEGGYNIFFYQNNELISTIFLEHGQDGADGLNGIDGINGNDGVSTTITTEITEGGYYLIFWENEIEITRILVQNGQDGVNGTSSTIRVEETDGGYNLYITTGDETTMIFVANGVDGTNGLDGANGTNGVDGTTVTVKEVQGGVEITTTQNDGSTNTVFVRDGVNGTDGLNSIVTVDEVGECVVINSGLDINRNFILDINEILYSKQICGCSLTPCEENCNGNSNKVELCHKLKIGNDWKFITLFVPQSAVQSHLNHGDSLGKCQN